MTARNAQRLEPFYLSQRQALFTYALSLTESPEAAEDLLQAVFEKLLAQTTLPAELRPYVFRMVRNAAIDRRRQGIRHGKAIQFFASPNGHPDPALYARYREIEAAMTILNDNERECIVLKALNGFTLREISQLRNVPPNTAASWYRRGLAKLRKALEESP